MDETTRVLRAFRLSGDKAGGKAYDAYLEARAKDPKTATNDASLAELRRGWYVGEMGFGERVLAALSAPGHPQRRKGSSGGEAAKAHGEAQAERIAKAGLAALKMPVAVSELRGRAKWELEKGGIAAVIRERTGVSNRWIAERLGMGHESSVTREVKRAREDTAGKKLVKSLKASLCSFSRTGPGVLFLGHLGAPQKSSLKAGLRAACPESEFAFWGGRDDEDGKAFSERSLFSRGSCAAESDRVA